MDDNQQTDDHTNLTVTNDSSVSEHSTGEDQELLDIKRSALQDLSPLLDHLQQSPKETFDTTMMMIQATDNKALVAKAYEAAKQIESDKNRAQALLDLVNEINYLTGSKN